MPRGKKNSDAKTTSKPEKVVAVSDEPIKEKVAEPEKGSVQKKKATVPKKAAATKTSAKAGAAKKVSASASAKLESAKTAPVTEPKTKESTAAKTKTSAASTAKKTASTDTKKPTVKKTAKGKSDEVVFQSSDKDYTLSEITEICKNAYRGGTRKQIKSIKVYVKAENNKLKAYYVVNDDVINFDDIEEFSDELKETVHFIIER